MPLPGRTRAAMERRFGTDFGGVRIHDDGSAAGAARAMGAAAFTVGSDVVFGADRWAPDTAAGLRLLAHELAHVVQQGRGGTAGATSAAAEAEAARVGAQVAGGARVAVQSAAGVGVQCAPEEDEQLRNAERRASLPEEGLTERSERSERARHTRRVGETIALSTSEGHHALPKFLGGRTIQSLVRLPHELHYLYHRELNLVLRKEFARFGALPADGARVSWKHYGKLFDRLGAAQRAEVLQRVLEHAEEFDNRPTRSGKRYFELYRSKHRLADQMRKEIERAKAAPPGTGGGSRRARGGGKASTSRARSSTARGPRSVARAAAPVLPSSTSSVAPLVGAPPSVAPTVAPPSPAPVTSRPAPTSTRPSSASIGEFVFGTARKIGTKVKGALKVMSAHAAKGAAAKPRMPRVSGVMGGPAVRGGVRVAGGLLTLLQIEDIVNQLEGQVQVELEGLDPGDFETGHEFQDVELGADESGVLWTCTIRVQRNVFLVKKFYARDARMWL